MHILSTYRGLLMLKNMILVPSHVTKQVFIVICKRIGTVIFFSREQTHVCGALERERDSLVLIFQGSVFRKVVKFNTMIKLTTC